MAHGHVVAGLQPLANVVAGQNSGHHIAAAQTERQADSQSQSAEHDQDGVVQQLEVNVQLVEGRHEDHQAHDVVASVGQVIGIANAHAIGTGGNDATQEASHEQAHNYHHRGDQQVGNVCHDLADGI